MKLIVSIMFLANSVLFFGQNSVAQNNATRNIPSPRNQPAAAFDQQRGKLVVFGGIDQSGKSLNDTWEWDGAKWTKINTANSPSARAAHAVAFDAKRNRIVLFGGQIGANALADTWEYDGNDWQKIETINSPPARVAHALVYDFKRGKIILFGGTDFVAKKTYNDTWEFDGKTWTQIKTANAPEGRFHYSMTFDLNRNRIVLFGGNTAIPPLNSEKFKAGQRGDTWEFDGKNWKAIQTENSPPKRDHLVIAYDSNSKKIILFGGFSGGFEDGIYLGDTWVFDGKNWKEIKPQNCPEARGGKPTLVNDSKARKLVLFGGGTPQKAMNDLWTYDNEKWLQLSNYD